ncbi:GTPase family protein [Vibrio sp. WXL103]|uniref:GTPase family protein n=1 Tax=unclassified Vibrio TaxID=2614977 RepID=UPI003EC61656
MRKIKQLFILLYQLSGGRWGIAVASAVLPVTIMAGFGVALAFKYGYLLPLSLAIAFSTLVVSIPLYLMRQRAKHTPASDNSDSISLDQEQQESLVEPNEDWSPAELAIWQRSQAFSRSLVSGETLWSDLDEAALELLSFIAEAYDKKALDFTLPEGLKLAEEVSRRYRKLLDEYGFALEAIKVSHLKSGYDFYEQYGEAGRYGVKAAIWLNHAKNLYINPVKAISDIGTQQFSASMTRGLVDDLQLTAKQALLDEVSYVAIELYSGRFLFEQEQVAPSKVATEDLSRHAAPLEPVRIVIVGQTGAGRSSLVNQFSEQLQAEVDVLPSAGDASVYRALLQGQELRIIDLPGLDGSDKRSQACLEQLVQADIVLWVLRANQSAREPDNQLKQHIERFYSDSSNISRQKPVVIGVLNQVDQLSPIDEWMPPYDLTEPANGKAKTIAQAIAYNQKLLAIETMMPLSIDHNSAHFGVEELKALIYNHINQALNVQRNRQRHEAKSRGVGLGKQFSRLSKSSKKLAPAVVKSALPRGLSKLMRKFKKSD